MIWAREGDTEKMGTLEKCSFGNSVGIQGRREEGGVSTVLGEGPRGEG